MVLLCDIFEVVPCIVTPTAGQDLRLSTCDPFGVLLRRVLCMLGDVGDAFFPHSVLKAALWFDYVATAEKELRYRF